MANNCVVKLKVILDFAQCFKVALYIHQCIVCFMHIIDHVSQLTTAPIFNAVDVAPCISDHRAIALDHGRYFFTLIRMDQKHNFVVSHALL